MKSIASAVALPHATDAAATKVASKRWLALDLLRFLAVVMMVQGHAFYEIVGPAVREQYWYRWHGYVHGFTAPIFLFAAGTAFGITTLRRWDQHTKLGPAVYRRLERYGILIGLGYLLHMGVLSLSWFRALPADRQAVVLRVDALHHIGFVLLLVEGLALLLKRRARFLIATFLLFVLSVVAGPYADATDVSSWPLIAGTWVNRQHGSLFPLVPWSGFLFGGVLIAAFVHERRTHAPEGWRQLFVPLAALGALLILVGDQLVHQPWQPFPEHSFWKVNPWWCLIRLGVVIATLAFFQAVEQVLPRGGAKGAGWARSLQVIGGQTLVIYVAHLMLIYGRGGFPGIAGLFHESLSLSESIGVVLVMLGLLFALGWLWDQTQRRHPVAFGRVKAGVVLAIVLSLLLS